ncbi:hydrogenase small subunit [Phosphitispora fastidiosa]|uniref:hydrogenase small subunit n=1 Tax=Phosphitispora fastidiosa TaxID=2837202 RepID=UPI001E63F2E2|nr:hydrogenase small subunit [Phosphitispora fastidiosa]MBU7007537.1 hydrogenase small subunit [Phosphitispora fastidiosa]
MKRFSRRQFIKLCTASVTALGISQVWVPAIGEAFQKTVQGSPPVLWIQGSACNGCSSSLMNSVHPNIKEVLDEIINISYHPGLAAETVRFLPDYLVDTAQKNSGKFILVVEGAIPTADHGNFHIIGQDSRGKKVTLIELLEKLGELAETTVAVGSCASFGGISAAEPNDAECVGLEKLIEVSKVINIPGCPPHPDWIVGTLAHLLLFGRPELDDYGRPKTFFQGLIHNNCPRRQYFDNSIFARKYGEEGCLLQIGCKGPLAHGDCPTRLWNGASSWCVNANAPCIGCTDPSFPDLTMPFYKRMPEIKGPGITSTADAIGITAGAVTAAGFAVHLAGNYFSGRIGKKNSRGDDK